MRQAALDELRHAHASIARAHVGSISGQWGLLSSDIEATIEHYPMRSAGDELRQRLEALDSRLFDARICAHAGDDALATELTKELAECADLEQDDARARWLTHHLPVWARRIPAVDMVVVADKLDAGVCPPFSERYFHYRDGSMTHPSFPLGTIRVSFSSISELKLHDIVVDVDDDSRRRRGQSPRPRGLGSAVLEHLCRSAHRYSLAISGDIMPGDRTEQTSERLARWYERHGVHHHSQVTRGVPVGEDTAKA